MVYGCSPVHRSPALPPPARGTNATTERGRAARERRREVRARRVASCPLPAARLWPLPTATIAAEAIKPHTTLTNEKEIKRIVVWSGAFR